MSYLGIDIGGTEVKGILCDASGTVHAGTRRPTNIQSGKEGIISVTREVILTLSEGGARVEAIGIGTAGRINAKTGDVVYATDNLPGWMGINIPAELKMSAPVFVDNDANAALLGEHWLGAAKGRDSAVMLTLGTGVGGANLVNGAIVQGATWNGGEWGHVILVPGGHLCNCGNRGCMEQYLSGAALTRMARETVSPAISHGRDIWPLYASSDPDAVKAVDTYLQRLSIVIYNIHTGINPACIVIGGGVIESKDAFWEALQQKISAFGVSVPVVPALLGNRAGCFGAARMAINGRAAAPFL
ncbi:MAG: ROK family protein [bacterium]|nr:ROK family protein [Candidatus Sumerlaeota bacterium]